MKMPSIFLKIFIYTLLWEQVFSQETEDGDELHESSYKEAEFLYPQGILSERDIPVCANDQGELIACNFVNKRYFYPPRIERLCRCPDRSECPWEFSEYKVVNTKFGTVKRLVDNNTVMVSSRGQLKFCNEVTNIQKCIKSPNETALRVVTVENIRRIYISCHCPAFKRWKLISDETKMYNNGTKQRVESYICGRLPRCRSKQMCGHVREDNYSTFFLCSCPKNHLCYPRNMDEKYNASEALYRGTVVKSYCIPD